MATQETIKDFFEEQFGNTSQIYISQIFLYKDKQLLKQGKYREFAEEQIKKANKVFWSMAFSFFILSLNGIRCLIEYGNDPNWFDLTTGLVSWFGLIILSVMAAREYYTIKSSMTLFLKLLEEDRP